MILKSCNRIKLDSLIKIEFLLSKSWKWSVPPYIVVDPHVFEIKGSHGDKCEHSQPFLKIFWFSAS